MTKLNTILLGLVLVTLLSIPQSAIAQGDDETCSTIVQDALSITEQVCQASTGRNQACYGNITLLAEPQPGIDDLTFEQQGDIVDVDMIRTLQLSSMNRDADEWGVAYLQLQANLPDDTSENLTLLLFGDVSIENAVEPVPEIVTIEITSGGNLNVRGGPSTNNAIVGSLSGGDIVTTDGRIEDGSWLRIRLEDETVGWVFAQLVTTSDDIMSLDVVDPDAEVITPGFGPLQAFFVETGVGDAPCETAPDSGLLIQTPEGVAQVNLFINEVDIRLQDATSYVQSQPNNEMTVNIVEGTAVVTAQDASVFVPAGTRVRIDMDANNVASSEPSDPEAYDGATLASLPILELPRTIALAEPNDDPNSGIILIQTGTWIGTWQADDPDFESCGNSILETNGPPTPPWEISSPFFLDEVTENTEGLREGSPSIEWELTNPELNYYVITGYGGSLDFIYTYRILSPVMFETISSIVESNCTSNIRVVWEPED